ncbi:MAG: hypothetical protein QXD03_03955, partial [Candidatus Anstonellales archaeon]
LFVEKSLLSYIVTTRGAVTLALTFMFLSLISLIGKRFNLTRYQVIHKGIEWFINKFSRLVARKEYEYYRDLNVGKIHEKTRKVKMYRFLNDLIIDLGLKQQGATPYEFLFVVMLGTLVLTILLCQMVLGKLWLVILTYPIMFVGVMCILYTKANIAHDTRIDSVIEAENIICNNIKNGVVVAVKNSIHLIPLQVRPAFEEFLDNVEHKNYHVATALMILNNQLGSIADNFIKKAIQFELEEEHGLVGMFQDIVELNNIKTELRNDMRKDFEAVTADFIISMIMIIIFLGGVLAIYDYVAHFYFKTTAGQLLLIFDLFLIVLEFVIVTYLKAQEL